MITEAVIVLLVLAGAFFSFVAAVGVVRFPDVYTRAHAVTKVETLGVGFVIAAAALHFQGPGELFRAVVLLGFIFYTSPTAAHAITRAAYSQGIEAQTSDEPLSEGSQ